MSRNRGFPFISHKRKLVNIRQNVNPMRKVTEEVCGAFLARKPRSVRNTSTDGTALFLHGNRIAEWRAGGIWITTAHWNTVTTRERLNGLPCCVHQCKGLLYLNGEPWSGEWTCIGNP